MMTSGRNNPRPPRPVPAGFTLLEMIAVMAVMMLMLGIASFAMRQGSPDPTVRKPGNELIRLAKTAVRASATQGRGFALTFDRAGFSLVGSENQQRDRINLPKGMKISIKRWGGRDWQPAEGHRWWFGSQGLCEPLSVRIDAKDSALMMKFNPLTGTPSEEEMEVF
jgi:prepilin-type N-terminal cleavage/methylation domain-containing protein